MIKVWISSSTKKIGFAAFVILTLAMSIFVSSEDPFCNNKCHNSGITTIKTCYCDEQCVKEYNDCCGDSELLLSKQTEFSHKSDTKMKCRTIVDNKTSIMVIDSCPSAWKGPDIICYSCMGHSRLSEGPLGNAPVTNPLTGVTYNNYYCAICNGGVKSLVFWKTRIRCPTLNQDFMNLDIPQKELLNHIFYNKDEAQWGFFVINVNTEQKFFLGCDLIPVIPMALTSKIRRCDPELVAECPSAWKDDHVKHMCNMYIDPVFTHNDNIRYRNLYCAICNREDISQLWCGEAIGPRQPDMDGFDELGGNFALLLDVDISDGNKIGKRSIGVTCTKEEIYDPFVKRCRNIVCGIPGFVLKDRRCVQGLTLKSSEF